MSLAVRLRGFLRCYKSFQPHARFFGFTSFTVSIFCFVHFHQISHLCKPWVVFAFRTFIPENSGNGLLDSRKWKTPFLFIGN